MAERVLITGAVRTPIGKYIGSLKEVEAYKLGAIVLNEAVARSKITPQKVDEVIFGQAYQNGESVNVARMSLLAAGWPVEIPGITLDRRCLSGLDSIFTGLVKIQSGYADVVAAGGVESMSRTEFYIPGEFMKWGMGGKKDPKWGLMPRGHGALPMWGLPFFDRIQRARVMSQPIERFGELNSMMSWAEAAARQEKISRQDADEWAVRSHRRAVAAMDQGRFDGEIIAVPTPVRKNKDLVFEKDETPRPDISLEKLAGLSTVYEDGICTAGNSSTENDGAAAVVIMSEKNAADLNAEPLAELISFGLAASDPRLTYPAVPAAVDKALKKAGLTLDDMDLIEIQEAFAAQVLADTKMMNLKESDLEAKVNVNGSGISLGHPIAATGTMRLVTLVHEMKRQQAEYGLVAICGGGGQGIAAVVKV
ncbi:thiolase family protein [Desulfospira joergensenii]|uniref:thiolase family protein n=1 Tax=Desulfospira joergensenii TaxID=53329 RepID=UPI0003B37F30|nr:acetyl-CoA C-acyltransferase [Desulfospira joergensenii]